MSYYKRAIVGYSPEEQELLDRRDQLMKDRTAQSVAERGKEEERSDFLKVAAGAVVIIAGAMGIRYLNRK